MTDAWSWRPDPGPWYESLDSGITTWAPSPAVIPEPEPIRGWLRELAGRREGALLHPCTTALTDPEARGRPQRDVQLAVWAASRIARPEGVVEIPAPMWLWTADGGVEIPAGTHALAELAGVTNAGAAPVAVALDVWCHSLDRAIRDSWAERDELEAEAAARLEREVYAFLRSIQWLTTAAPELLAWVCAVTRVVVPLCHEPGPTPMFHSGSSPELPGLIHCDLHAGELAILEALIHESAHRHLYIAEARGPLVDPDCEERFASPLRPEPRPLRGILLACHALAYICLFQRRAVAAGLVAEAGVAEDLARLDAGLHGSFATLTEARHHLTIHGAAFVERLAEVIDEAR